MSAKCVVCKIKKKYATTGFPCKADIALSPRRHFPEKSSNWRKCFKTVVVLSKEFSGFQPVLVPLRGSRHHSRGLREASALSHNFF